MTETDVKISCSEHMKARVCPKAATSMEAKNNPIMYHITIPTCIQYMSQIYKIVIVCPVQLDKIDATYV